MTNFEKPVSWLRVAQGFFILDALVWVIFGAITLFRMGSVRPELIMGLLIIAVLMVGNAGVMIVSAVLLPKRNKWFYAFALAVLLVNIILTFTDQFGLLDFLTLVLDLIILGILVWKRPTFLKQPEEN